MALTHRNWTGGLLLVNASSYILGASIQPLAWLCVGCSGLVRVYQACAVFPMFLLHVLHVPFTCSACSKVMFNMYLLHVQYVQSTCSTCTFYMFSMFKGHVLHVPFACSVCHFTFTLRTSVSHNSLKSSPIYTIFIYLSSLY